MDKALIIERIGANERELGTTTASLESLKAAQAKAQRNLTSGLVGILIGVVLAITGYTTLVAIGVLLAVAGLLAVATGATKKDDISRKIQNTQDQQLNLQEEKARLQAELIAS